MEFLMMNSSKIDEKHWKNLLTSKINGFLMPISSPFFDTRIAGHPLAQNERSLHVFLQEPTINLNSYIPGKIRST